MTPPLKGVVFDVDGTLLTSSHQVSPRMQAACAALSERGIWLSIASARPPRSVQMIARLIGAQGPLCALNGAVILDRDGTLHNRRALPDDVARALAMRFMHDSRVSLNIYSGTEWLIPRMDARIGAEAEVLGFGPSVAPRLDGISQVEKVLLMADEDHAIGLARALSEEGREFVVARSNPGYVEISPAGINKAVAVKEAAHSVGLSLDEIVACGDGENDIQLVRRAGYGIAMGHAPAELRSVAGKVVGSNDDDSLAVALMSKFSDYGAGRA